MKLVRRVLDRISPTTAISLLALFVALGGVAMATIPDGSGKVNGCYDPSNAQGAGGGHPLSVVESAATCTGPSVLLPWSQTGPQGAEGPQGPSGVDGAPGPQGPAGPSGSGSAPAGLPPAYVSRARDTYQTVTRTFPHFQLVGNGVHLPRGAYLVTVSFVVAPIGGRVSSGIRPANVFCQAEASAGSSGVPFGYDNFSLDTVTAEDHGGGNPGTATGGSLPQQITAVSPELGGASTTDVGLRCTELTPSSDYEVGSIKIVAVPVGSVTDATVAHPDSVAVTVPRPPTPHHP